MKISVVTVSKTLVAVRDNAREFFGDNAADPLYGAPLFVVVSGDCSESDFSLMCANAACIVENMHLRGDGVGTGKCLYLERYAGNERNLMR